MDITHNVQPFYVCNVQPFTYLVSFIDPACRCSGLPIFFRDYIDCICHIWYGPGQLGFSVALGDPGFRW